MGAISFAIRLTATTFILFFTLPSSNGINTNYRICASPFSCGHIHNIGYPFCGGSRPQFCGHPDFLLDCPDPGSSDYPDILIGNTTHPLRVKLLSISSSTHRLSVVLQHFFSSDPLCHSFKWNHQVNLFKPFKFTSSVENINIFYGCPVSLLQYHPKYFNCSYSTGGNGTGLYFGITSETVRRKIMSCYTNFTMPVLKREVDEMNNGSATLMSVLRKGLELEYIANFTSCSRCQNSGGICGSSEDHSSKFVCYCPDGPQSTMCPKSVIVYPPNKRRGRTNLSLIVVSASSMVGIVMLIIIAVYLKRKGLSTHIIDFWNGEMRKNENVEAFLRKHGSVVPKRYTYSDIRKMTDSFKHKLGEGGFGGVYKGKLDNGRLVAVKLLKKSKGVGEEFINEVASIGGTNHVNVVTLLGFCSQGRQRALVYEFMPNGSLDKFIYSGENNQTLPWKTLFNISVGIAKGLEYLHRGCTTRILHFDIKPHNILLDAEFQPKISDFGLSRLCPQKESIISMSEARGAIGYIAPEVYCRSLGGVSHKSDVYSYGMMALEMSGARKNMHTDVQDSNESFIPRLIYEQLELGGEVSQQGEISDEEKELQRKMIIVSLWCIQTNPLSRPSINRVVEMLEGSVYSLQMPPMPSLCSTPNSTPGTLQLSASS